MTAEKSYLSLSTISGGGMYSIQGKLCVMEPLGMVFSHRTQGIAWYHDLFARIRDFFGGGVKSYDKPVQEQLILPCLRELSDQACALYDNPHAVIGVTYEVNNIAAKGMSMMSISGQGTAIRWVEITAFPVCAIQPLPVQVPQPLEVRPIEQLAA